MRRHPVYAGETWWPFAAGWVFLLAWAFCLACVSPALAVDVVNRDKVAHEVVVNADDGQSKVVSVPARQKVSDVCKACIVVLGRTSAEAADKMTVLIEGGKVSIGSGQ